MARPTMPSLLVHSAPPGGVITAAHFGDPGIAIVIVVSLRGPTVMLPGLLDPIWCAAPTAVVAAADVTPISGFFAATLNVPSLQALRGFALVAQAGQFAAAGALAVSNPSPGFVR